MSDEERIGGQELETVREGLMMARPPDPERLAEERRLLASLEGQGLWRRVRGYWSLSGPGYLQSAMTLGGGTASASLFAGAVFGYELLWVAPVAMLFGVVMLSAVAWQTLSTGMRPFGAMRRFAGAPFAWGWAIGALLASVIWHFPQYALASAVLVDLGHLGGLELPSWAMGGTVLIWAVVLSMSYGSTPAMVRRYERLLKLMVWFLILCFGMVVVKTGVRDWGAVFDGFFTFQVPDERNGVAASTVILSGMAAAVGVNMVFLYPYSLLARGWGREHRRLARFDLVAAMLVPYVLTTALIVIATANTYYFPGISVGKGLSPLQAAQTLGQVMGSDFGRVVFDLGVLAMALSTITLHMLCAGFVAFELFGWKVGSWRHRLATLIPVPGVLGAVYWSDIAVWVGVPTSAICGLFLPLAYVGFIRLQRSRPYLGDDVPRGPRATAWLGAMILGTVILVVWLTWFAITKGPGYIESFR